jgi:Notch-like protein
LNGGICDEGFGSNITCNCSEGFSGPQCEIDLDFCTDNYCLNGGTCIEGLGTTITCMCPPGITHPTCKSIHSTVLKLNHIP